MPAMAASRAPSGDHATAWRMLLCMRSPTSRCQYRPSDVRGSPEAASTITMVSAATANCAPSGDQATSLPSERVQSSRPSASITRTVPSFEAAAMRLKTVD